MRPEEVRELLTAMQAGNASVEEALTALQRLPVEDLGFARLDIHRELRQGLPEAIYAEGKTPEQVTAIAARLVETTSAPVLATRVSDEAASMLTTEFPNAVNHPTARVVIVRAERPGVALGTVSVVCAGTWLPSEGWTPSTPFSASPVPLTVEVLSPSTVEM
jgi:pyridinium-3,5-biscarboxylic acid mononucleotide synthase